MYKCPDANDFWCLRQMKPVTYFLLFGLNLSQSVYIGYWYVFISTRNIFVLGLELGLGCIQRRLPLFSIFGIGVHKKQQAKWQQNLTAVLSKFNENPYTRLGLSLFFVQFLFYLLRRCIYHTCYIHILLFSFKEPWTFLISN